MHGRIGRLSVAQLTDRSGETPLAYGAIRERSFAARVTTGLDQVLGASAGRKHFGARRLSRSGLADPSNV